MTTVAASAINYHRHELMRLSALRSYDLLDTGQDDEVDVLVRSAALLIAAPIAALAMVDFDRQWFKAIYGSGTGSRQVPRAFAACSDVVAQERPLVVPDLAEHPRYSHLSWVERPGGPRSFVGVPVTGPDGLPLGVLCVLDRRPRSFDQDDIAILTSLTASIVALLERRREDADVMRRQSSTSRGRAANSIATPGRIRAGLDAGEFEAFYQPIVGIADRRMVSMESLIRWNVPTLGLLAPNTFMPQVQRSPLLSQLVTDFMLHSVCRQVAHWRRGGFEVGASVNVTGSDASSGALFEMVTSALDAADLPARALTVELTETVGLLDRAVAVADLRRLRDIGVRISLDDFGVGYSGLEFLGLLPVTGVKIDHSFVGLLDQSHTMRAALDNVVALGRSLGLDLVAEGIETEAQAGMLMAAGVRHGQGYFYAEPVPAERISRLLADAELDQLPTIESAGPGSTN